MAIHGVATTFAYDDAGVTKNFVGAKDTLGRAVTFGYDARENVTSTRAHHKLAASTPCIRTPHASAQIPLNFRWRLNGSYAAFSFASTTGGVSFATWGRNAAMSFGLLACPCSLFKRSSRPRRGATESQRRTISPPFHFATFV